MKFNYVVNYGVNWSHRKNENKVFERYKDTLKFYKSIDKSIFTSGEIVKLESNNRYEPCDVIIKLEWKNGKEL